MVFDKDLNLEATELRLGLPGTTKSDEPPPTPSDATNKKRSLPDMNEDSSASRSAVTTTSSSTADKKSDSAPPTKAQVVGWPPVRSFRKNVLQQQQQVYVKVSMDGAPYLRKIDLKVYRGYPELMKALEEMFKFRAERDGYINGSDFVPTYEDKDGDWMLVGDVPWSMFINCCKRLRIMKGSEARGLAANGDGGGAV